MLLVLIKADQANRQLLNHRLSCHFAQRSIEVSNRARQLPRSTAKPLGYRVLPIATYAVEQVVHCRVRNMRVVFVVGVRANKVAHPVRERVDLAGCPFLHATAARRQVALDARSPG